MRLADRLITAKMTKQDWIQIAGIIMNVATAVMTCWVQYRLSRRASLIPPENPQRSTLNVTSNWKAGRFAGLIFSPFILPPLSAAYNAWALFMLMHHTTIVTPKFVLGVASFVSGIVIGLATALVGSFGERLLKYNRSLAKAMGREHDAVATLAKHVFEMEKHFNSAVDQIVRPGSKGPKPRKGHQRR